MNKTTEALLARIEKLEAANKLAKEALEELHYSSGTVKAVTLYKSALAAIREALADQSMAMILNDPHPPHRLCECTACLEYWTPLPDCDAFAGGGKPIDHIANTGKMIAEPVKQEPVAVVKRQVGNSLVVHITGNVSAGDLLYTRPVRTKDLTDDEIEDAYMSDAHKNTPKSFARAVIVADREKNK